jgi:hypothetical protein
VLSTTDEYSDERCFHPDVAGSPYDSVESAYQPKHSIASYLESDDESHDRALFERKFFKKSQRPQSKESKACCLKEAHMREASTEVTTMMDSNKLFEVSRVEHSEEDYFGFDESAPANDQLASQLDSLSLNSEESSYYLDRLEQPKARQAISSSSSLSSIKPESATTGMKRFRRDTPGRRAYVPNEQQRSSAYFDPLGSKQACLVDLSTKRRARDNFLRLERGDGSTLLFTLVRDSDIGIAQVGTRDHAMIEDSLVESIQDEDVDTDQEILSAGVRQTLEDLTSLR